MEHQWAILAHLEFIQEAATRNQEWEVTLHLEWECHHQEWEVTLHPECHHQECNHNNHMVDTLLPAIKSYLLVSTVE